jgi:hypothetical protein
VYAKWQMAVCINHTAIISQAMFDAEVRLSVTLQRVRLKSDPFSTNHSDYLEVTNKSLKFANQIGIKALDDEIR